MKELPGANNSLNDSITTINLGALGAWYQVKTAPASSGLLAI